MATFFSRPSEIKKCITWRITRGEWQDVHHDGVPDAAGEEGEDAAEERAQGRHQLEALCAERRNS